MAGGWTRDGAVQDQIDDTVSDAVAAARARMAAASASGLGARYCDDCGEAIAAKRRKALPGTRTCINCQGTRDGQVRHSAMNRRGSKDSQLR
ncbi:DksA/TraR family C4-type zinc finger protein [Altererythrobacter sp. SALINAS58]|uniref:DksA/TraR family C4-type zinc finger protein n=1 Tax=Alteripontixanthobacter muriae TaxID=2705546 RepID=UPI00157643A0|nr:DksA/TraR family C4-type zinc finger protein [Alteripontixanthobacter muriae]NTZ43874.1 DksA/TraR family C4-type zinc finger protein [Alteripontixanthobacter muriae]